MSFLLLTPIKDEEWFKNTKAAVFRGEIEPDDFDTEDYKYFDKIRELGYKYRAGQINREQFKTKQFEHLADAAKVCDNIRRTEMLRVELNKSESSDKALKFALEIAEICTGESGLKDRILKNCSMK